VLQDRPVTWTSSDYTVALIDAQGRLEGVSPRHGDDHGARGRRGGHGQRHGALMAYKSNLPAATARSGAASTRG
jgi:hypothetical protein